MHTIESLLGKIERAKDLDFGIIFSESIELFKKTWIQGLLLQVFSIIIMLPIIIVFYLPFIGLIIAQQESGSPDPEAFDEFFASMSFLYLLFIAVAGLVLGVLSTALYAAFFRIMKKLDYNEQVLTSDFFYFFKTKYLVKVFVLMLIMIAIAIPSALLCYIPLIYLMVPMSFFAAIFAFNEEFSPLEIVKVSFKLGNKKWLLTFGLLVVSYICLVILTFVTCGLGSLFLNPFLYHPIYLIYKNVVGFNEPMAIDEIATTTE